MSRHDETVLLHLAKEVSRSLGLRVDEAIRGIQYGIALAHQDSRDAGDRERTALMRELFQACLNAGSQMRGKQT